eukprot:GHVS01035594.1.p1 GENE.GHVS01035594.1~~GHVS01035594.1.p1  ORF type:complete len:374 (-),score=34.02 GHVS01035594.1:284-1405(-)
MKRLETTIDELGVANLRLSAKAFQSVPDAAFNGNPVPVVATVSSIASPPDLMKEMESALKGVMDNDQNYANQKTAYEMGKALANEMAIITNHFVSGAPIVCEAVGSAAKGVGLFIEGQSDIDVACKVHNPDAVARKVIKHTNTKLYRQRHDMDIIRIQSIGFVPVKAVGSVTCTFNIEVAGTKVNLDVVYFKEASEQPSYCGLKQVEIMKALFKKHDFARPVVRFLKAASAFVALAFPKVRTKLSSYAGAILVEAALQQFPEHGNGTGKNVLKKLAEWLGNPNLQQQHLRCTVLSDFSLQCEVTEVKDNSDMRALTVFEPLHEWFYQGQPNSFIISRNVGEVINFTCPDDTFLAQRAFYIYQGMWCLIGSLEG